MFFQVGEQMVGWRGQIGWIGRVFQHFKVQISQLPLRDDSRVLGTIVLEKQHSSWQFSLLFGDQCLLHFFKERCVVVCCACCTLFKVVNQQYPIFVLENNCYHFSGWLLCLKLLWTRRTTVPPILRLFFCLWVIQVNPCFIHCYKSS